MDIEELTYTSYMAVVSVEDWYTVDHRFGDVKMQFVRNNPKYNLMEVILRAIYLIIAGVIWVKYYLLMKEYLWKSWDRRQKVLFYLLLGLLAFNNPLYGLQFIKHGWVFRLVDTFFTVAFVTLFAISFFVMDVNETVDSGAWCRNLVDICSGCAALSIIAWGVSFVIWMTIMKAVNPVIEDTALFPTKNALHIIHGFIGGLVYWTLICGSILVTRSFEYPKRLNLIIVFVWTVSCIGASWGMAVNPFVHNAAVVIYFLTFYNVAVWLLACGAFPVPQYVPPPNEEDPLFVADL